MRAGAEQHGDDHLGLGVGKLLAQLGQMAAGQMPGLVREHADDLVRRLRLQDRAVIDEDAAAVGDERVEEASLTITIWMFCFSRPAARRIGRVYSRSSCSVSVSRRTGGPLPSCACAAGTGSSAIAAAVTRAVRAEAFLRNAIWSNIKRSGSNGRDCQDSEAVFVIGFGDWRRTGYAICPYEPYNAASLGRKRPVSRTEPIGPPAK